MPLVGVVELNSFLLAKIALYLGYFFSQPARSRMPGLSVAEPKYFSPAFFAQKSSWADAVSKVHASMAVVIRLNFIMTCDDENFRDKGCGSECESHEGNCRSGGVLTLLNNVRRELATKGGRQLYV